MLNNIVNANSHSGGRQPLHVRPSAASPMSDANRTDSHAADAHAYDSNSANGAKKIIENIGYENSPLSSSGFAGRPYIPICVSSVTESA
jgi:hypothetical protein